MGSMTHRKILDQRQLLRLRKLREEIARSARDQQSKVRESAAETVRSREHAQRMLRTEQQQVAYWAHDADPESIPQWAHLAQARAARLSERIKLGDESLQLETKELSEAQAELDKAHAGWIAACSHTRAVDEWLGRSLRQMAQETEQRAEREQDAANPANRQGDASLLGDTP